MGALGGLTGTAGGAGGSGFSGVNQANLMQPVSQGQADTAYGQNQTALSQQGQLLNALQQQPGIQQQENVYNQLQGVVNGTGPNPAQAMLNQQTGQNVANQAALMAGQRGASANVGLLARQAAQQGAATQQQAVGQGAALQANQSLNALGQAGSIAGNQVANQIQATGANTQAQQGEQQNLLNAIGNYNSAQAGSQASVNAGNTALANTTLQGQQGLVGGLLNNAGAGAHLLGAEGLDLTPVSQPGEQLGPQSSFAKFLSAGGNQSGSYGNPGANQLAVGASSFGSGLASMMKSGSSPAAASSAPKMMSAVASAQGGEIHDYRAGGNVKAKNQREKAVMHGNSYANDKIPAVLSEGEVVIPRNVMQSQDPASAAARFVQAVMQKRKMQ